MDGFARVVGVDAHRSGMEGLRQKRFELGGHPTYSMSSAGAVKVFGDQNSHRVKGGLLCVFLTGTMRQE